MTIVVGGILVLVLSSTAHSGQAAKDTVRGDGAVKRMVASPADPGPPEIDGRLDDPCWRKVRVRDDFIQQSPNEGAEPTERTEVQVIYDRKAVYIGVRAYDSAPDKIQGQQRRRDDLQGLALDDGIMITIDSYHDHQTGYEFHVNSKGATIDYLCHKDVEIDFGWDGIWEAATSVDSLGWTAEFCIPFSSLRFPKSSDHTWGFNVSRYIARKKEGIQWQLMTKAGTGYISRLGHLAGLEGLSRKPTLEFLPFLVSRATFEPKEPVLNPDGRDLSSDMGVDMKYNVRPDVVLNAAVNPDFGQVEADPSILNLTAFETLYPEKRPFFIEGTTIFDTPLGLFYSRRIGRRPGQFQISPSDQIVDYPDFTTILFAGKLTGKTEKGTALGFIEAVTAEEYATVDSMGIRKERLIEPLSNYLVARVSQDIWKGNSTIGALLTAANRRSGSPAYSGGFDWNLKLWNNTHCFSGQLAASSSGGEAGRDEGYAAMIGFGKVAGEYLRANLGLDVLSPEFEINDLGYLMRNDLISFRPSVQLRRVDRPWWIVRSIQNDISSESAWNFDGDNLAKRIQLSSTITFLNYYYAFVGGFHSFPCFDDRSTRGGPLLKNLGASGVWCGVTTDAREPIHGSSTLSFSWSKAGTWSNSYDLSAHFRLASTAALSLSTGYTTRFTDAQWLANINVDSDGSYEHSLFGELEEHILDFTLRADMAFTPTLSLQLYVQPYVAVGDYLKIKELARPASYEFLPFDLGFEPDYNWKSLRANLVLRWEYYSGSVVYLVWSQGRSDESDPGEFSPGRNLSSLFNAPSEDIILVKLQHRFGW